MGQGRGNLVVGARVVVAGFVEGLAALRARVDKFILLYLSTCMIHIMKIQYIPWYMYALVIF